MKSRAGDASAATGRQSWSRVVMSGLDPEVSWIKNNKDKSNEKDEI